MALAESGAKRASHFSSRAAALTGRKRYPATSTRRRKAPLTMPL